MNKIKIEGYGQLSNSKILSRGLWATLKFKNSISLATNTDRKLVEIPTKSKLPEQPSIE